MVIKNDFNLHHGFHLFTSVEQHDKYKEHVNNFNNGLHKTGRKRLNQSELCISH